MRNAHLFKKLRQDCRWKAGLTLIQIARQKLYRQQAAPLQFMQDRQQGIAVLTTGQADEPLCSWLDHAVLLYRLAGLADNAFAQLFEFGRVRRAVEQGVNVFGLIQHAGFLARLILFISGYLRLKGLGGLRMRFAAIA